MLVDFLLRAAWVAGYAVLIRLFILAKAIESSGPKRTARSLRIKDFQSTDSR